MRIGVTQRIMTDPHHGERRDALAIDWHGFLDAVWPGSVLAPIPNAPSQLARFLDALAPDLLLLTGGNDLGSEPDRDATEAGCLEFAEIRDLPVIGVCRGFQMLVVHDGGRIAPARRDTHVGRRHGVHCLGATPWGWNEGERLDVNSFHGFQVPDDGLPATWRPLAKAEDGGIEAAQSRDGRILAVMWHPEREPAPDPRDVAMLRNQARGKNA